LYETHMEYPMRQVAPIRASAPRHANLGFTESL